MIFTKKKDNGIKLSEFAYKLAASTKRKEAYRRSIRNIAHKIEAFEKEAGIILYSNSITENNANDFVHFLKMQNLRQNTVSSILQNIHTNPLRANSEEVLEESAQNGMR